jgi:hypothetical protein
MFDLTQPGPSEQTSVSVQGVAICDRHATQIKHDFSVDHARKTVRSEVMYAVLGNNDQVRVGDAVAMNQVAHTLRGERRAHPATDALSDGHDVCRDRLGNIGEVVYVLVRDHETFARRGRLKRHERRDEFVAMDETGGRSARDDLTEDARHYLVSLSEEIQPSSKSEVRLRVQQRGSN